MRAFLKHRAVLVIALVCFLGVSFYCLAQNTPGEQSQEYSAVQTINQINAKIDKLALALDRANNKEILAKLDQVLSNQQKILAELDVVKVRATRK